MYVGARAPRMTSWSALFSLDTLRVRSPPAPGTHLSMVAGHRAAIPRGAALDTDSWMAIIRLLPPRLTCRKASGGVIYFGGMGAP